MAKEKKDAEKAPEPAPTAPESLIVHQPPEPGSLINTQPILPA